VTTIYLDPKTMPEIAHKVARVAFPDYAGRKFSMRVEPTICPQSYWDGGSRTLYRFVRLSDMAVLPVPTLHPAFDGRLPEVPIPAGVVCVEHHTFRSKDMGLTFVVSQPELLPQATAETSLDVGIVLVYTAALKPSYAGKSNYRLYTANDETGITAERWEAAKAECIAAGLLNKAGAITPAGRNAAAAAKQQVREAVKANGRYSIIGY